MASLSSSAWQPTEQAQALGTSIMTAKPQKYASSMGSFELDRSSNGHCPADNQTIVRGQTCSFTGSQPSTTWEGFASWTKRWAQKAAKSVCCALQPSVDDSDSETGSSTALRGPRRVSTIPTQGSQRRVPIPTYVLDSAHGSPSGSKAQLNT